jgi:hypothetical protein
MGLVVAINLGLVWWAPVLPGQDLPQHMATTRIMLDYERLDLPFFRTYELPETAQPYFTTYYLLVLLARLTSVDTAARLLLSGYVLLVFLSFRSLVGAIHGRKDSPPPWTPLLATLVVWSPSTCMGFLAFVLAVPLVLFGCATIVHAARAGSVVRHALALSALGALLVSVHAVAAGCLVLFLAIFAVLCRQRRITAIAAAACVVMAAVHLLWARTASHGLGELNTRLWVDLLNLSLDFESSNRRLGLRWSGLTTKGNYLLQTALGPFRFADLLVRSGLLAVAGWLTWSSHRRRANPGFDASAHGPRDSWGRRPLTAALAFLGVSLLVPWGQAVPSEITFLNFRIMSVAFPLVLACLPPAWFLDRPAKIGLLLVALSFPLQFGYRVAGLGREAQALTTLLADARPSGPMLPLVFHNKSDHFAPQIRLTHFLPMYYTVFHGEISGQFWARYNPHLPIDYRPGARLSGPPDWHPESFHPGHLRDFDHVLVQAARPSDPEKSRRGFASAEAFLSTRADPPRCSGPWCLYRIRRP